MTAADGTSPIALVEAASLHERADRRVTELRAFITGLGIPAEVIHVGSTAHGAGLTKGDVDALVRVDDGLFDGAVAALADHLERAQPDNWTTEFASFTDPRGEIPVGVQVVRAGSEVDVRMRRQHRLLARPEVRAAYDRVKREAAPEGPEGYWRAKDAFWTWLGRTTGGASED